MTDVPSWPPVTLRGSRVEATRPGLAPWPGMCLPFAPATAVISASKILCIQSSQPPRSGRAALPRHNGSVRQRKADVIRQISHSRRPAPETAGGATERPDGRDDLGLTPSWPAVEFEDLADRA